jgi:hypothetical protein
MPHGDSNPATTVSNLMVPELVLKMLDVILSLNSYRLTFLMPVKIFAN